MTPLPLYRCKVLGAVTKEGWWLRLSMFSKESTIYCDTEGECVRERERERERERQREREREQEREGELSEQQADGLDYFSNTAVFLHLL